MVTAELERKSACRKCGHGGQSGCVPETPGLAGGDALAARESGKNQQVNHADAPHDVLRRSGTDLAPSALRENCA